MARNPRWLVGILKWHLFQPNSRYRVLIRPFPHNARMRYMGGSSGEALVKELERKHPEAAQELKRRDRALSELRGSDYFKERAAMDRWLDEFLTQNPESRKRYLKNRYREETAWRGETQGHSQLTAKNRHARSDSIVLDIIQKQRLNPVTFLEIGAAFYPEEKRNEDGTRTAFLPAQTTIDTKEFFHRNGIQMKFIAVDVTGIPKDIQFELARKYKVLAIQQDYRKRKISGKYGIVRIANVSSHMKRKEFESTLRHAFEVLEENGILIISNRLVSGLPIAGNDTARDEIGIYQKIKAGNSFTLKKLHYSKEPFY